MRTLITGHNKFAEGLKSSLELIAGPQQQIEVLPFLETTNLAEFQEALIQFCRGDEKAIIFTDLLGGTPFNMAMMAKSDNKKIHILTGTNLPMLLEYISQLMSTQGDLIDFFSISEAAKEGITVDLDFNKVTKSETEEGEGI